MRFTTIPLLVALLGGCASTGPEIQTRPAPPFVVSNVVVPMPPTRVASTLSALLKVSGERDDQFYRQSGFRGCAHAATPEPVFALAEDRDSAVFGRKFFSDPDNSRALYVTLMGVPMQSSYYFAGQQPACYAADFAVSIEPAGEAGSTISVRSINPRILSGREFNAHAFGFVAAASAVAASPTDEYRLLVYIARALGTSLTPP
jgi:hypothetical protein